MIETRIGDMARHRSLRNHASMLKRETVGLTRELTTGIVSDKTRHLNGDLGLLAGVTRSLELALQNKKMAQDAAIRIDMQQAIVEDIRARSETAFASLNALRHTATIEPLQIAIHEMSAQFHDIVGKLNTTFAGRPLMSGTAGGFAAVASPEAMLDDLIAALPPGATADQIPMFVSQWFAPGGGFDVDGYLGGPPIPAPLRFGDGVQINLDITAETPELRKVLSAFATGAVLARGIMANDTQAQRNILEGAAIALSESSGALINLSARIGITQSNISTAETRATAEYEAMTIAKNKLVEADPYEAAARLEQTIAQIELIFSLTARLSRMSLAEYLR